MQRAGKNDAERCEKLRLLRQERRSNEAQYSYGRICVGRM